MTGKQLYHALGAIFDVVVDAVGRLAWRADLRFTFIGTGQERARIEPALKEG